MLFRSGCHGHDRQMWLKGSETLQCFPAVFAARVQIKEDDINRALPNFTQGFVLVRSGDDIVILHCEGLTECLAHH